MNRARPQPRRRGFVLLEALLATAIFALGILTLGRCVSHCLAAERFKAEDVRARRALENRAAEIEAGAVLLTKPLTEDLKEPFAGLKLEQTTVAVKKVNEKKEELSGLLTVTLRVSWRSDDGPQSRELIFYALPRNP
jgi:hypothetical protein